MVAVVEKVKRRAREGGPLPVRDATRPLALRIKKEDVLLAKCGDPRNCVVARALDRALGDLFVECHVGAKITKVMTKTEVIRYETSNRLSVAIPRFDNSPDPARPVWDLPPGTYELKVPTGANRLGGKPGSHRKKGERRRSKVSGFHPRAIIRARIVETCSSLARGEAR